MSLKNWSVVAANNTTAPPDGAPESSTKIKDWNDIMRQVMAKVRCLAAPVTIASAATTDLGASDETITTVSGTVTITSFGTVSAGIYKIVTFSGALTLTHNATSLILLGGANRTTVAGDCGLYVSLGAGNWKEYFYSPIGVSYQPLDAQLTTLAGITATQATDLAAVSTFIGTLLNDADAAAARTTLGISGTVLQVVHYDTSAVLTGSTLIPHDDTIPQQTEGDQYMQATITPKSATSTLVVDVHVIASSSVATRNTVAVFRDATAASIGASVMTAAATYTWGLSFSVKVASASVAATAFNVRIGPHEAASITFNGLTGARIFGGAAASSIRITEIAA